MIKHSEIKNHIDLSMMNRRITDGLYFALEQYIAEQEKKEEELKYIKEQFNKYWKEVCILKPKLAKVEELLELYRSVYGVVQVWNTMPHIHEQIKAIEEELK